MLSGNIYTVPVQDTRKIQNYCNIPQELRELPNSVVWKYEQVGDRQTKNHTEKWHEGEIEFPQHVDDV